VAQDHILPGQPRASLTEGDGATLARMEQLLGPLAGARKPSPSIYALQVALRGPHNGLLSGYSHGHGHGHGPGSTGSGSGNASRTHSAAMPSSCGGAGGGAAAGAGGGGQGSPKR
jgi:hypothetical protein